MGAPKAGASSDRDKRLSWAAIIGIWLVTVVASLGASYLVQRFVLGKPDPDHKVAVLVGSTVPVLLYLGGRRRRQ